MRNGTIKRKSFQENRTNSYGDFDEPEGWSFFLTNFRNDANLSFLIDYFCTLTPFAQLFFAFDESEMAPICDAIFHFAQ